MHRRQIPPVVAAAARSSSRPSKPRWLGTVRPAASLPFSGSDC